MTEDKIPHQDMESHSEADYNAYADSQMDFGAFEVASEEHIQTGNADSEQLEFDDSLLEPTASERADSMAFDIEQLSGISESDGSTQEMDDLMNDVPGDEEQNDLEEEEEEDIFDDPHSDPDAAPADPMSSDHAPENSNDQSEEQNPNNTQQMVQTSWLWAAGLAIGKGLALAGAGLKAGFANDRRAEDDIARLQEQGSGLTNNASHEALEMAENWKQTRFDNDAAQLSSDMNSQLNAIERLKETPWYTLAMQLEAANQNNDIEAISNLVPKVAAAAQASDVTSALNDIQYFSTEISNRFDKLSSYAEDEGIDTSTLSARIQTWSAEANKGLDELPKQSSEKLSDIADSVKAMTAAMTEKLMSLFGKKNTSGPSV